MKASSASAPVVSSMKCHRYSISKVSARKWLIFMYLVHKVICGFLFSKTYMIFSNSLIFPNCKAFLVRYIVTIAVFNRAKYMAITELTRFRSLSDWNARWRWSASNRIYRRGYSLSYQPYFYWEMWNSSRLVSSATLHVQLNRIFVLSKGDSLRE